MTRFRFILLLNLVLIFLSCSSMTLEVTSEPDKATVYIKEGTRKRSLGETPLKIQEGQLPEATHYNLLIEKEGFQAESVVIESRSMKTRAKVFASLKKLSSDTLMAGNSSGGNTDVQQRKLASIQLQLLKNNYSQAENAAKEFVTENPYSAVGWSLLGNAYILQNRNSEAQKAYQKALHFDPNNKETQDILNFLQQEPTRRSR